MCIFPQPVGLSLGSSRTKRARNSLSLSQPICVRWFIPLNPLQWTRMRNRHEEILNDLHAVIVCMWKYTSYRCVEILSFSVAAAFVIAVSHNETEIPVFGCFECSISARSLAKCNLVLKVVKMSQTFANANIISKSNHIKIRNVDYRHTRNSRFCICDFC